MEHKAKVIRMRLVTNRKAIPVVLHSPIEDERDSYAYRISGASMLDLRDWGTRHMAHLRGQRE